MRKERQIKKRWEELKLQSKLKPLETKTENKKKKHKKEYCR